MRTLTPVELGDQPHPRAQLSYQLRWWRGKRLPDEHPRPVGSLVPPQLGFGGWTSLRRVGAASVSWPFARLLNELDIGHSGNRLTLCHESIKRFVR